MSPLTGKEVLPNHLQSVVNNAVQNLVQKAAGSVSTPFRNGHCTYSCTNISNTILKTIKWIYTIQICIEQLYTRRNNLFNYGYVRQKWHKFDRAIILVAIKVVNSSCYWTVYHWNTEQ